MSVLKVSGLSTGYGSTQVLSGVSFALDQGSVLSVFGRNGVGKTTLLRGILGLLPVSEGDVEIMGRSVRGRPTHQIIREGVAFAAQEQSIFPDHTVRANLEIADRVAGRGNIESLLDQFPRIRERLDQKAGTLSGGEQKMLLAVRTLGTARTLAILDEIVEGVQPNLLAMFQEAIVSARARGLSILLVEQHLGFALPLSDQFLVISGGRVVDEGPVTTRTADDVRQHLIL